LGCVNPAVDSLMRALQLSSFDFLSFEDIMGFESEVKSWVYLWL